MTGTGWLSETRTAYDTVAEDYARVLPDVVEPPLDRAVLSAFAETVGPGRPALEVGAERQPQAFLLAERAAR
ncbi:hypothetical protein [Micromonospora robiginosa]|uniref:SAM-dependent methyltransferase n=1 Tax=Micromonospora robiginosa TaxID=2749844 RepID=A0AAF0SWV9_9ACTN|nr:hypothetical protein [Micromonospora ferruginea]WMF04568.1 hypothetical protein H1D33_14645 [Micromonospora ferruginea]